MGASGSAPAPVRASAPAPAPASAPVSAPAPASTSASSSQVPCGKYDVFISFRGPDVRFGFLSHLERDLRGKNIDVYVDDMLERGEEISSSLLNAIEGSRIALVIFSKHYASSRWCLKELVKIMEFKEAGQQIVIPVFYHVDPSDVRHQKRTYEEAFTLHEEKSKGSVDNLQIWRAVLEKSAHLSGHHSTTFRDESKLIDAIVEDVLKKLKDKRPIVPNLQLFVPNSQTIIGSHQNFTIVESLMDIKSQEVRLVGIWGMGGIGKTTLARAIFERFLSEFGCYYFLENMREKSTKRNGFNSLRDELLSKLLDQKDHKNNALKWLQPEKVLIALDDVDNPKHLKDLVRLLQLGPGSRVIVTSRDKHVLRSGGIPDQFIHGVNELSSKESLELFSIHAFNQSQPQEGYQELSKMTATIAKGIPLALEVLGSHFHSRDKVYWESELSKLKRYPHEEIQNILKISYDGLHPMDKEIFSDIAYFFVGGKRDEVTSMLEAFGFKAVSGIQNLIEKALIKLDWDGRIVMHDLIREMAEQIVRGENMRHPERCSQLKNADEIYDILKNNMGTDEIEGIILDMTQIKYVQVEADIFVKMKNLRFLKFFSSQFWLRHGGTYVDLLSDLESFPNKLRYLHWDHYPSKTLPSGSYLENLAELHMGGSNVKRLWDGKQDLGNLKKINLRESKQLIELPDLSMAHKLESVDLHGCESLRSLHPSILSLPSLITMEVSGCSKLESIECETPLESLSYFRAFDCCLKKLCLSSKKLSSLCFQRTEVGTLNFPIGGCIELTRIRIEYGMVGSVSIDELCCLRNLEEFNVTNLKQVIGIKELDSLFGAWPNLRELWLDGSAVETLPASVNRLSSLKRIYLRGCKRLKSILGLPPSLRKLDASDCTLLETVSSDSLVRNNCAFKFRNCEKLDERSVRYIHESIRSSMTSARVRYDSNAMAYFPGSRVPEWMKYKPLPEAFNATELTCNPEQSQDLLICCFLPKRLGVHFTFNSDTLSFRVLNRDHVLLWHVRRQTWDAAWEFFLGYWDEEGKECRVPAKECGLLHYLEPEIREKRIGRIKTSFI